MADTLSQKEIDALREAVKSGTIDDGTDADQENEGQVKVIEYNFRKPRLMSTEQEHLLQIIHDQVSKELQATLSSKLKTTVEVKLVAIDQLTYGEYVLSLQSPTYIATIQSEPDIGRMAIEMNTTIALSIINVLLGGNGVIPEEVNEMTIIERKIYKEISEAVIGEIANGWSSVANIELSMQDEEVNPEYVQLVSPDTACLNITLDTHIGELSGVFNICYPFMMIQALLAKAESHSKPSTTNLEHEMLKALSNVSLELSAVIGNSVISADQLGHLKDGDVLCLNTRYDAPVKVYIGQNLAYHAVLGQSRGKAAVQMIDASLSRIETKEIKT